MKFKKVMLVTFLLLAILTIGAVSASENVTVDDEVAASDVMDTPIEEAPVDEVIAEDPPTTDYTAEDFNFFNRENVGGETTAIFSLYSVPAYGNLTFYVNDNLNYNEYINDKNPYKNFVVSDLGIYENAKFNIRAEYIVEGSGQVVPLKEFTADVYALPVTIMLPSLDIDVENDFSKPDIGSVYDDNGIRGTIIAYMDGIQVFSKQYTASDDKYSVTIENFTYYEGFTLGNHTVKIVYTKNGKEYSKEGNVTFYAEPKVINPGYTMTVGDNKYVTVNYYKGSTGTMVVYNTVKDSTVSTGWKKDTVFMTFNLDGNGTVYIPLNTLSVGYHGLCLNITLGTYSVEKFVDFNVIDKPDTRPSPNLVLYIADIKYGNDATIEITANSTFSGVVLVQIGEIKFNVTVKDGFGTDKVSNLSAKDNYYALATFTAKDSDAFRSHYAYKYFSVEKARSNINLDDYEFDLDYGDSLKINVTNLKGATGFIAKLDGENATVEGNAIIISGLTSGTHYLEVYTIPEDNYKEDSVEAVIRVANPKPKIIIDENIVLIKGSSINVNVTTIGAKGITAKIDGNDVDVNGYVIEIPDSLSVGNHTLTVTTIPDTGFEAVTKNVTITVKKFPSAVSIKDNNLVFDYNKSAFTEVSFENATGVTAEVVGHPNAAIVNGNVVTVSGLDAGSYTLKVTTIVDESHDSTTATANITVNKLQTGISLNDTVIVFDYKSNASTIVLTDAKFVAEIVGQPNAAVVNGNVVTVSGLDAGSYTLKVIIDDVNYEPAFATANVTVNKIAADISVGNIAYTYGSSGSVEVSTDAGAVIAEVIGQPKANVVVNGKKIIVSGLAAGDYVLNVTTTDANYEATSATANITVKKAATSIAPLAKVTTTYYSSGQLIVCLKDANGNPIQGKYVTVVIGKSPYDGWTNAKGRIYITTPKKLTVGKYYPTLTFNGDENYTGSTGTAKLVVNLATPKLTYKTKVTYKRSDKKKKYAISLKTDLGAKMKNTKVVIKVNKVNYKGYTNNKGQFTFKLTKLTKKGKYTAYVKYGGEKNKYNALNKKVIITVK